jgi:hypothetical protein
MDLDVSSQFPFFEIDCDDIIRSDQPTYVVYHELILTSKEYMTQVTAIDAYWLGMNCYLASLGMPLTSCHHQLNWALCSTPLKRKISRKKEIDVRPIASFRNGQS